MSSLTSLQNGRYAVLKKLGEGGKGYGKQFFNYFEPYMRNKGYDEIVYYAFDPGAVRLCRKRGYKEAYGVKEAGPYGKYETDYVFYLKLKKDETKHHGYLMKH